MDFFIDDGQGNGNSVVTRNLVFYDTNDGTNGSGSEWVGAAQSSGVRRKGKSFANVSLEVVIDNDNRADGFTGRKGFLRVWGGNVSPAYVTDVSLDANNEKHFVELTLPGVGNDREFKVQVLDESFTTIADSGIFLISITDSGKAEPSDYTTQRGNDA